jgi:hypothetical protein
VRVDVPRRGNQRLRTMRDNAEEGRSGCSILFDYLNPVTAALIDHINPRSFGVCTSGVYDYGYYGPAVQLGCVCPVDDRTSCICSAQSD